MPPDGILENLNRTRADGTQSEDANFNHNLYYLDSCSSFDLRLVRTSIEHELAVDRFCKIVGNPKSNL